MPFATDKTWPFTQQGIQWLNRNQIGVYGIFNGEEWIYIGRGDIRGNLLAHLGGDNPCITRHGPTAWTASVTPNAVEHEKKLILEYRPACNRRVG